MTFSYGKVNDQIYLPSPLSNLVFTLSYTWSYITPKLIMDSVLGITYPKPVEGLVPVESCLAAP